jgi:hypothetical protein
MLIELACVEPTPPARVLVSDLIGTADEAIVGLDRLSWSQRPEVVGGGWPRSICLRFRLGN